VDRVSHDSSPGIKNSQKNVIIDGGGWGSWWGER
jgi:hypothetical protein